MAKNKPLKNVSRNEKYSKPKMSERKEAWFRIIVAIISGIILGIWKILVIVLLVLNWIIVVFSGKRNKGMADICEYWNTETYKYIRYLTFVSNKRPFPFSEVERMTKFE
ncbi:DUF4389 domain-containing protein [Candidatus Pacearchaeota archaeon]|nr:DUF4389 domain-containing protein [Candidatus Pacearchaeota archaeon]